MTLQIEYPGVLFRMAGNYSAHWDERAQVWWARRVMDAVEWRPNKSAYTRPISSARIGSLVGAAVVQYGHRAEVEVIVPRHDAYVAELQRQFDAGYAISDDVAYSNADLDAVRDWLSSLNERMLGKLWKLSWTQGVEHADRWHAELAKAAEDQAAGERDISRRIDSHDGWTWCRLGSVWAMDREGAVMGHCVGQGGYDGYAKIDSDVQGIWSLRDTKGRSHVTAEIGYRLSDRTTYFLEQAKGPKNRPVTTEQQGHIKLLSRELKLAVSEPGAMGGLGSIYAAWMDGSMRRGWINIGMGEWADANVEVDRDEHQRIERVSSRIEMTMRQVEPVNPDVAEALRQRAASNFTEYMAQRMRVAFGFEADDEAAIAGADIPAGSVVTRQHGGIMLAIDTQGGCLRDGSAIADAIAAAPKRTRVAPPPPPHYRQLERRGRLHGRT